MNLFILIALIFCLIEVTMAITEEVILDSPYFFKEFTIEPNETVIVTSTNFPDVTPPTQHHPNGFLEYFNIFSLPFTEVEVTCDIEILNGNCSEDVPTLKFADGNTIDIICQSGNFTNTYLDYVMIEYVSGTDGGHKWSCEITSYLTNARKPKYFSMDYSKYVKPSRKRVSEPKETTCDCGTVEVPVAGRIIHGEIAEPNYYTWVINLFKIITYDDNTTGTFTFCGGSIITSQHIMTAAHCTLFEDADTTYIGYQVHDKYNIDFDNTREIIQWFNHEEYNITGNKENDISIGLMISKIDFGLLVSPACLSNPANFVGKYVSAIGWGLIHHGFEMDNNELLSGNVLMETPLKVIPIKYCERIYGGPLNKFLCQYMIQKGSCQGDSGSPQNWFNRKLNKYIVIGLTSFGHSKCSPYFPSVSVDVSGYIDWIRQKINETNVSADICIPQRK